MKPRALDQRIAVFEGLARSGKDTPVQDIVSEIGAFGIYISPGFGFADERR